MEANQEPDIDLAAALKGRSDDPPPHKRSRRRPRKVLLKGQEAPPDKNKIGDSNGDVISKTNLKERLKIKEIKFLEYFLSGELTIEEAMIAAGYGNLHPKYIHVVARKIIGKYENSAPEARKVFRDIGFGELSVAKGIKRLAQKGKSEVVQLNAYSLAAKCLQMTQEAPQLNVGFQVVIKCSQEEQALESGRIRPAVIWLREQEKQEESSE